AELARLFANVRRLYCRLGKRRSFDHKLLSAIDRARGRGRTPTYYPTEIVDLTGILHEMRLTKREEELRSMRAAAAITVEGHLRAMASAGPGMGEYEIEALLLEPFRRSGSPRVAYGSIVGSGPNATILHYRANDRRMQAGELLLVDAGCEVDHYASDVTRTFP